MMVDEQNTNEICFVVFASNGGNRNSINGYNLSWSNNGIYKTSSQKGNDRSSETQQIKI